MSCRMLDSSGRIKGKWMLILGKRVFGWIQRNLQYKSNAVLRNFPSFIVLLFFASI
jgi:hypothetical protein